MLLAYEILGVIAELAPDITVTVKMACMSGAQVLTTLELVGTREGRTGCAPVTRCISAGIARSVM